MRWQVDPRHKFAEFQRPTNQPTRLATLDSLLDRYKSVGFAFSLPFSVLGCMHVSGPVTGKKITKAHHHATKVMRWQRLTKVDG